jgi:hypothetical protein
MGTADLAVIGPAVQLQVWPGRAQCDFLNVVGSGSNSLITPVRIGLGLAWLGLFPPASCRSKAKRGFDVGTKLAAIHLISSPS